MNTPDPGQSTLPFDPTFVGEVSKSVHFRSDTCEWETPQYFFDQLDREFGFELDVCATAENAKCKRHFNRDQDGLRHEWRGTCWCNPPYGKEISSWVAKAYETAATGLGTIVCLIPARTDTHWWHQYVAKADEIRFVRGRLKFGGHANSAPFPSAIVIFKKRAYNESSSERPHYATVESNAGSVKRSKAREASASVDAP